MDDALKTSSIKNIYMMKLGFCFPSPNKFFGYAPGCTTRTIYQKILWFVFYLIYVVIISSSTRYLSELTMSVRRKFSREDKVEILLRPTLFGLLTIQRKWTYTRRFTLSTPQKNT